jgi:hypothetical protein
MGTYQLSGAQTTAGSGTIRTACVASQALPSGISWYGTVEYYSASAQTITPGYYTNLNATGGNRTLPSGSTVGISNGFTPGSGTYTVTGSTMDFNGSNHNIPSFSFNNLTLSGSGTKTALGNLNVAGNLDINGTSILEMSTYTLSSLGGNQTNSGKVRIASTASQPVPSGKSWYGTFEYYSASSQTIVPGFYTTLNGTGGNRVLSSTGNIAISNTFTPGSGTYTITGSTVEYNGGTQNLPAGFNYNNLNINGSGGKFALSDISIAGDLTIYGGVSFFTNTYQLTALSGSTFLIGTNGNLYTSCTSSTPLPAGKTWNFNVFYLSASAQTIVSGNYSFLSGTTGPRTLSSTGSIGISISFIPGSGAYTTTGSTVDYNGSGLQTIVAFNYHNLTSSSTGSRSLSSTGAVGVAGTFTPGTNSYSNTVSTIDFNGSATQTVPAFNYYNLTYSSSGTKNFAASGTIGIAGTFNPGSNPLMTVIGSTVDFNGTGSQTIPGYAYYNLTSSSSGSRTLSSSGTIYVANTFTPGTNSYTNTGSTITFTSSSSQTIPAFTYYNLESQSSGSRTLASSGTIGIAGTFTPGSGTYTITGSTINFNGSGTQTIPAFNYNNLTSSSTGDRTMASSGTIGIAGTFTPGSNSYTVTGSTVDFNGVSQPVPGFDFNNLTVTNASNKTVSSTLNIAGNLTVNPGAALDMGTNVLNTVSGSISGSGGLYTQNTSATPIPVGRTWPFLVLYNSTSAQTIVHGNYSSLLGGAGARTLSTAGTIGISVGFTPGTGPYTITNSTIDYNGSTSQSISTFDFYNLTLSSTGSRLTPAGGTIGIAGTFTPGTNTIVNGAGTTMNFNGTGSQTIPAFTYINLISSSTGSRTLASSINISGTFTPGTNSYTVTGSTINFDGSSSQTIPAFTYNNLTSSSTGSRTLASSGTIAIYSTFTPGTNSYTTTGSTIDFKTEANQNLPGFNYNNLIFSGNGLVTWTATTDLTITGDLTLNSGRILNLSTFRLVNLTGITSGTGWLFTSCTDAAPIPAGKTWNYKVFYQSSSMQTIVSGNYSHVEGTGGNRTLSSSGIIGISEIFTPGSGTYTVTGSTVDFNSSSSQTINPFNYNNLTFSSTGSRTLPSSGTVGVAGTFTPGTNTYSYTGSTINFNGSSSQTIPAFNYNNLTSSSSGTRTLASSGTITVYGNFTSGTNSYTTTGSTIDLKTEGGPTLPVLNYNNLIFSGNNVVTWTAAGDISVAGNLTLNSGRILNMSTYKLSTLDGTTSGTGWFYTSCTDATPIPAGKTWNYKVFYQSSSMQTIVSGNYSHMEGTGGNRTLSSSGTIGISEVFTPGSGTYTVAGSTVGFNGTAQTIPVFSFHHLTLTGGTKTAAGILNVAGDLTVNISATLAMGTYVLNTVSGNVLGAGNLTTQCTSATPLPSGKAWPVAVNYNSSFAQTIVPGNYVFLFGSGGNRTLSSSGTIGVSSGFTPGVGSYTTTGSTIDYNGAGSVTITAFNYYNLTFSSTGARSLPPTGTVAIAGTFTPGTNSILAVTGSTVQFNGTGQTVPAFSFNHLTIAGSGGATMTGNVTVGGILNLSTGNLRINGNTLTLNLSISGSGVLTGSNTSSITIGGSGAVGTLLMDQSTQGSTNRLFNLTCNRSGQTITLGNALEVTGTITPTAGTLATGGFLKLVSDASGTARIATGTGTYITGNVTAERYVPAGERRWRFMSSCMSNATLADWKNEIYITGAGGAANGFDATLSNSPGVYYYNETLAGAQSIGWVAQTNSTSSLTNVSLPAGKGYRVFIRGDRTDPGVLNGTTGTQATVTMNLIGTVNTGDITMPVTYTNSGASAEDGWNCLGNPYPSQYDWNAFWDAGNSGSDDGTYYTNIDPVISIYDPISNSYKSYNALSNTGTFANGIIPQGQSFMMKATGASPAMTFKEQYKTGGTPTAMFKTEAVDELNITIRFDEHNADDYILKFVPNTKSTHDEYDIIKKLNPSSNLSSYSSDNVYHTVDARPAREENDTVQLYVSGSNGDFTFTFNNLPQNDRYYYLEDLYLHTLTQINVGDGYKFNMQSTISESGGGSRFRIIISKATLLNTGIVDVTAANATIEMYPNPAVDVLNITFKKPLAEMQLVVINIAGEKVMFQNISAGMQSLQLDVSALSGGIYFIEIDQQLYRFVKTME